MLFGTVTGRIVATIADRLGDPDVNPDVVPVYGKVRFTPSVDAAISSTEGAIVLPTPIDADLDDEGYLSVNGVRGVSLVATDSPDLNPTGFTYTVSFIDLKFDKFPLKYNSFSMALPAGTTVDLSTATPVGSSNGAIIIRGVPGEKGATGDPGPQGSPGLAGASDSVVAGYFTSLSATRTAADARYAPASGAPVAGTGVYRQRYAKAKSTAVAAFQAKLGARHTTPCDILMIGDSITEGEGANAKAFRYVNVFRDRMRAFYPTPLAAGGGNYLTAYPVVSSYPRDPNAALVFDARFGLGRRAVQLAAGTPLIFTVAATSARIAYWRAGGTGSFSYSVNGGTATTVSTSGTQASGILTSSISGLTGINDTITINLVSGYVLIEGLYTYNGDETRGVRVWESGHAAWKASDFNSTPAGGAATEWMGNIANIQPSLVTICLGENDATAVSAATFSSGLATLIANVRSFVTTPPSIVLIAGPERNSTLIEPWSNYIAAMKALAANDTSIDVLDLTAVLPKVSTAPAGWYIDTVHPTNKGHAEFANALVEFITP